MVLVKYNIMIFNIFAVAGDIRLENGTVLKADLLPYGVSWVE